jgi:hypothetical protein
MAFAIALQSRITLKIILTENPRRKAWDLSWSDGELG